jgi:DNA (cytosine-5)-methyltransferase 1
LKSYTLSNDSKTPIKNIEKLKLHDLRLIYTSIKEFNNKGSIMDVKVNDIPEHDLLTYSFPCQDISIAGYRNGFDKDSGTRSSLV